MTVQSRYLVVVYDAPMNLRYCFMEGISSVIDMISTFSKTRLFC